MKSISKFTTLCLAGAITATATYASGGSALQKVMKDRGLNEQDSFYMEYWSI